MHCNSSNCSTSELEAVFACITTEPSLDAAIADVDLVEECAPERVDLKRALFARLEALALRTAILASASSALPASSFADGLTSRERCLVAHPVNPPYLVPVIELVPAPFTAAETVERAWALFRQAGMYPLRLGREIKGSFLTGCKMLYCTRRTVSYATVSLASKTSIC